VPPDARVSIVLVHSPLVGASSWRPTANALARRWCLVSTPTVASPPNGSIPAWRDWADVVSGAIGRNDDSGRPVVLVGHSAAGPLLPAIAQRARAVALVFVDARIPPDDGVVAPAEEEFMAFVRGRADADGLLPPWSRWWGDEIAEGLVPDPVARRRFEADVPRLGVSWFDDAAAVPPWASLQAGYVQLSAAYGEAAADARSRGWPVESVVGTHVSTVTDPDAVATAIVTVLTRLNLRASRPEKAGGMGTGV
jgi:hypothetical protein